MCLAYLSRREVIIRLIGLMIAVAAAIAVAETRDIAIWRASLIGGAFGVLAQMLISLLLKGHRI